MPVGEKCSRYPGLEEREHQQERRAAQTSRACRIGSITGNIHVTGSMHLTIDNVNGTSHKNGVKNMTKLLQL